VLAFSAGRRAREIGVRMALGAARADVVRMMLAEGMVMSAIGITCGLALAAATTRLMQGWLFGVSPVDAGTFAGVAAVFVVVALVASYIPARRAAAADPLLTLRAD
jgi:ABC-type antimicrobial peptide transport system permease subunit